MNAHLTMHQLSLSAACAMQDFMGFLHLGWDVAAREEAPAELAAARAEEGASPAWQALGACLDLARPGLATVRRIMGWAPLHLAAMQGQPRLVRQLVQELGADPLQANANSWTPLHCAAAHNQVGSLPSGLSPGAASIPSQAVWC